MIEIFFDGSCEPFNPGGRCGIGAIIFRDGKKIHSISEYIGSGSGMSNNVAEYAALNASLKYLIDYNMTTEDVHAFGDSQLVVRQMSGEWKIKGGIYYKHAVQCCKLSESFQKIDFTWIPREENYEADKLSHPNQFTRAWKSRRNPAANHCPTCGQSLKNSSSQRPGSKNISRKAVRSPCAGLADQHGTKGIKIPIL